jgi:hypothetical protein
MASRLKDANGIELTKTMEQDWLRFQKNFDRVKDLVKLSNPKAFKAGERVSREIENGQLTGKDRRFYNNFVGSEWDKNPIKVDEAGRVYYSNYNYEDSK